MAWKLGLTPILEHATKLHESRQDWRLIKRYVEKAFSEFCNEISSSELFDPNYLGSQLTSATPNLQGAGLAGLYLLYGRGFDYQSGRSFNGSRYWEKYPDVQQAGLHPLIHYLRHGKYEGRALPP